MTKVSVQKLPDGRFRSQPQNPVTGERLDFYGDTEDECIARREEARHIIRRFKAKLITAEECNTGLLGLEVRRVVTVRELWRAWCDELDVRARHKAITGSWARQCRACGELHLGKLGEKHPSELTAPVVETHIQGLRRWHRGAGHEKARDTGEFLSKEHQRGVWAKLQACVRWGLENRLVSGIPWSRAPRFVERRVSKRDATRSGDEAAKLLRVARERDRVSGGDLAARVGIMSALGLRAGEAVALAWDQIRVLPSGRLEVGVQFQARAHVRKAERAAGRPLDPPKYGSGRSPTFAANHPLVAMLQSQRRRLEGLGHYHPTGPVFPTPKGGWRKRHVVKPEVWRSLAAEAGLVRPGRKWTQHSARHSAGTMMAAGGATRIEIRDFMGHRDLGTTEGYFADALGGASGDALGQELLRGFAPADVQLLLALPRAPLDSVEDDAAEDDGRSVKKAARAYKQKQLKREVYDCEDAFAEWLSMGAPLEKKKGGGERRDKGEREAPPMVRRAVRCAVERAVYNAEKLFPEGWADNPVIVEDCKAKLASVRRIAARNCLNTWKGQRKKLAKQALARGEALPLHVRDWLGA